MIIKIIHKAPILNSFHFFKQSMFLKKVPVVKGVFFFGHALEFGRDPLNFLLKLQHENERIVQLRIVYLNVNLLLNAEDIKYVLQEHSKAFIKGRAYRVLGQILGNGMLTSHGEFWHRQRKLAQPAFYKQRLALLVDIMNDETMTMIKRWETTIEQQNGSDILAMTKEMMATTLLIVTKSLFGVSIDTNQIAHISYDIDTLNEILSVQMRTPVRFPMWIPTKVNQQFKASSNRLNAVIQEIISTRRNAIKINPEAQFDDLLQMLITAKDEDTNEQMTDKQLRDEIVTLFIAGHETTAMAMSWAMYLLSQHPEIVQKMRSESQEILGENLPNFENIRQLTYTSQVVSEVLRLYPPAWAISRQVMENQNIGEYLIPAKEQVFFSPYLLHRNKAYWTNPEEFNPDNFLPEQIKQRPSYAYLPFGGGPRLCIGNNFALMEMQIMLALLVKYFDFEKIEEVFPDPQITLKPKGNMPIKVSRLKK